ncbi:hypothetical protein J437_LFUL011674 [Ladona fulva]|uniref:Protein-lysine N-methyltransferase J437_LFUL011674 n=1 Tax=Ladona fulva TaxID=123851 RepID=A0A8K0KFQ6_LADFU|nr:hypothetical protein J437_LFUL011674 [Ladona fulva]
MERKRMSEEGTELDPSQLGTKVYWDEFYSTEKQNFKDFGDVGEIWFGTACAAKILKWLNSNEQLEKNDKIIDLGCGNGMLLIKLADHGWKNLYGVDYSTNAIDLATSVAESEKVNVKFQVWDILSDELKYQPHEFAVVLDKGTYDAISLSPGDRKSCRDKYMDNVGKLLKPGGHLLLTSCNWTEEELKSQFSLVGFQFISTLPAPTFQFNGSSGKNVASVIFKKPT